MAQRMDRARRLARSVELARLPSQLRNARAQPRTPTAYSADSHSLPLGARGPCRGCAGTSLRLGSTFRRRGTGRDAAARAKRREAAAQLLPPPRHHNTAGVVLPAPHGRCHDAPLHSTQGGKRWTNWRDENGPSRMDPTTGHREAKGTPTNQSPIPERKPTTCHCNLCLLDFQRPVARQLATQSTTSTIRSVATVRRLLGFRFVRISHLRLRSG